MKSRMVLRAREIAPAHHSPDPLETGLSGADDRIRMSKWLPPQEGVVPRIRIGRRWINTLWAIPLVVGLLVLGVAVAQQLRTMPGVQGFIARYAGMTPLSGAVRGVPFSLERSPE